MTKKQKETRKQPGQAVIKLTSDGTGPFVETEARFLNGLELDTNRDDVANGTLTIAISGQKPIKVELGSTVTITYS